MIEEKIKELQSQLTGELFEDLDKQQEIYELKKQLLILSDDYESMEDIDDDFDEGCLYCSG